MPKRVNNDPHTLFILAFSGGGTRAAALSYGVLEELRRTEIVVDGQRRRLIDEVDIITGVSGGSFTALAYRALRRAAVRRVRAALPEARRPGRARPTCAQSVQLVEVHRGHRRPVRTRRRLLRRDPVRRRDLRATCSPSRGRSPIANGTDISTGSRLSFYQNDFDLLCSDLNKVRLSRAAATSSAVPVVLSAVTFDNYGGTCGYEYPGLGSGRRQDRRAHPVVGARGSALPRDAGFPEQQGAPVHTPRRRRRGGQHRDAQRAGSARGGRSERDVPRRNRLCRTPADRRHCSELPFGAQDRLGPRGEPAGPGRSAAAIVRRAHRPLLVRDDRDS